MRTKRISESRSIISNVMQPSQANPNGNVHGGEIMKIMDTCAGVAAMRHCKSNAVTLRVDELIFHCPVYVGQLVVCEAELVYTGHSSMEIRVTLNVDDMTTETPTKTALSAYFTFVALDSQGVPCEVPQLELESDEERAAFEMGRQRHLANIAKSKKAQNGVK